MVPLTFSKRAVVRGVVRGREHRHDVYTEEIRGVMERGEKIRPPGMKRSSVWHSQIRKCVEGSLVAEGKGDTKQLVTVPLPVWDW